MTPRERAMSWMTPAERERFLLWDGSYGTPEGDEALEIVVWASQRYELVVLRQQLTSPPRSLDVAH